MAIVVFAIAVTIRLAYLVMYAHSPFFGNYVADHEYYRDWALRIAQGQWIGTDVFEKGPLYSYLLGIIYRLFGCHDLGVLAGQLTLGSVTAVLTYSCAKRIFGKGTGLIAGVLSAIYGPMIYYECMIMKSFLLPLMVMLVLYAGLRYGESRCQRWLWLSGIAIGLACLVRENHVLLAVPTIIWVWAQDATGEQTRARRLLHCSLVLAAVVMPIVPCAIRNYAVSGQVVSVTAGGGEVFYMAFGPEAEPVYSPPSFVTSAAYMEHRDFLREAERRTGTSLTRSQSSQYWFRESFRAVIAEPGRVLFLTLRKGAVLFRDFEVPDSASFSDTRKHVSVLWLLPTFGWIMGAGFLGVFVCLRSFRRFLLPLGLAAMLVLSVLLTYNFGRFRIGLVPLWILFAAHGLAWLKACWKDRAVPTNAMRLIGAVLLVAILTVLAFLPLSQTTYHTAQAMNEGITAMHDGDFVRAESQFRLVLSLAKGTDMEYVAHNNLGAALTNQGKLREALGHFARAVELKPDYHDAVQNYQAVRQFLLQESQKP